MKRIIVCCDGTWNKIGGKDGNTIVQTNVEKMFNAICADGDGIQQVKAYVEGVGTGYTLTDKIMGGTTGAGIDKNIKDMYSFLVMTYQPGDEIYLFGFSRGAYTARSIGGFIRNCGILKPENYYLIQDAYNLYRDRNGYTTPDSDMMKYFRSNYCYEDITPIKFIGVWDTVGSLGIPLPAYKIKNIQKYKFHDVTLSSYVENAYHALAVDEKRKLFLPTLWEKSETVKKDPNHKQKLEQRWFSGVHSNVGGGYADSGLSDIALQWLIAKAKEAGLCYNQDVLDKIKPDYKGVLRNSYSAMYWFWRPVWRTININDDNNQSIDDTVYERYKTHPEYKPKNIDGNQVK